MTAFQDFSFSKFKELQYHVRVTVRLKYEYVLISYQHIYVFQILVSPLSMHNSFSDFNQDKQLTVGLHSYQKRQNSASLLAENRSVWYVQSVPITQCTIHLPRKRTAPQLHITKEHLQPHDMTPLGDGRCEKVSGHPRHLYVHSQLEHIDITDLHGLLPV